MKLTTYGLSDLAISFRLPFSGLCAVHVAHVHVALFPGCCAAFVSRKEERTAAFHPPTAILFSLSIQHTQDLSIALSLLLD